MIKDLINSWWVRPLAVDDGEYLWISGVDRRGNNVVYRDDVPIVLDGPGERDEHNAAALAVDLQQDTVIAAYSRHNTDTHVRVQHIDRDSLTLGSQQEVEMGGDVTYAQLWHSDDMVILACRVDGDTWRYRVSEDWGDTWGSAQTLFSGTTDLATAYVTSRQTGTTVHLAHYGHPEGDYRPVGYCKLDLTSGDITKLDTTVLGNLSSSPNIDPMDLDQAIVPSSGYVVRLLDIGIVASQPTIAYCVWHDSFLVPTYKIKRWNGSAWTTLSWELAAGQVFGHNSSAHYHGGVGISDDNVLRSSRHDGSNWLIEEWTWNGSTFVSGSQIAASDYRLIRPTAITGGGWFYQDCLYEEFTRYYGDIV